MKSTQLAPLSDTQLCRKLHSDLQDYAMQFIESKSGNKIATKIKLAVSHLKQSQQFQSLAIKFWIIIINLQYDDVKRLTMNFSDR